MTTEWIVYLLLVGGLLACAAAAMDGILRRAAMPTRWVWVTALLATTALSAMSVRRAAPTITQSISATMREQVLPVSASRGGLLERLGHVRTRIAEEAARLVGAAHYRLTGTVQLSLVVAWITTSAGMLVILVLVHRGMARERRRWPLALLFDVSVRITPSEGPAVVGITTPEIVVPRWLLARTAEEQRLVVVHEGEHITSRDHLLLLGGMLIAALFPWHPAVWWAVSRLRLAIELDCDARVLHRGEQPRPYGKLLIDIAGQCAGHRVAALAIADRPSHLERRLLAMKNTKPRFTLVRSGALGALATLSILGACEARVPTSAEIAKMDVSSAEKAASAVLLPAAGGSLAYNYMVDEKSVPEAEARALPGSRIASVSIAVPRRGSDAALKGVVSITTVEFQAAHPPVRDSRPVKAAVAGENMSIPYGKDAPLFVVDGVIAEQSALTKLRSADIASVEVLKGAAATAAWSHPAAVNGVVKITMKHGTR